MKLRAYRITGPAMFDARPLVHICVQETKDTRGIVGRLLGWMCENDVYTAPRTGGTSGGGFMSQCFEANEAEKVIAWLKAQGVVEGVSDPASDPEDR